MKAIDITGKSPSGNRQKLQDLLPLTTPLVIQIFPFYGCNLKCNYCIFQKPMTERPFISKVKSMPVDNYIKYVKDMAKFPEKIKLVRFVGIGEPLLHKGIADMVEYTKAKKVAEKVEIITNGVNLKPAMSNLLIDAGLDKLEISIQGLTSSDYYKNTRVNVWVDQLLYNISYFYKYKKETKVYIKIVDSALEDKDEFFKLFGDICDYIGIESTVPIHEGVDLPDRDKTQFGQEKKKVSICPQPFFMLQINPDGNVIGCQSFDYPEILGNANNKSIVSIWNGEKFNNFRKNMITKTKNRIEICKKCNMPTYRYHIEDDLDELRMRL